MTNEEIPPPWAHQWDVRKRAGGRDNFALFWEMGTGKSRAQIDILRDVYNRERRVLRTLVLAPLIVVPNWKDEFLKYSKIDPNQVVLLHGTQAQRKKQWDRGMSKFGGRFVAVTNYDKLVTSPDVRGWLATWKPEVLVCDESHKCKSMSSKRTKAVIALSSRHSNPDIRYKYLLSGTPILKDPMDLFPQFLILDGGATLGEHFWGFKKTHMVDRNEKWKGKPNYFPKWELKDGAAGHINQAIQTSSMRVTKDECLDLPPLVRERRYVGMTPTQRKAYQEMKKDFIAFINDKATVANLALTKAMRLMQIASGYAQMEDGTQTKLADTPKQEALRELLEELTPEHKVLVWSVFRENYAQIRAVCESLGIGYVEINGDVTGPEREANIKRFREDPLCRVFSGHPGSGGIGINLVEASYSIFYSRTFDLAESLQAEARNHRGGSEIHKRVTRIDLVCENSIEEMVLARLDSKEQISEATLRQIANTPDEF